MRQTVHNRKNGAVSEDCIDDVLHDCFRLAIDTIRNVRLDLLQPSLTTLYGLPAGGLIKNQDFALSDHRASQA